MQIDEARAAEVLRTKYPGVINPRVYFIEAVGAGLVKIGTSTNVTQRLAQLQSGFPYELKLLRVLPGYLEEERFFHDLFTEFRMRAEWFESEVVKAWIASGSLLPTLKAKGNDLAFIPSGVYVTNFWSWGFVRRLKGQSRPALRSRFPKVVSSLGLKYEDCLEEAVDQWCERKAPSIKPSPGPFPVRPTGITVGPTQPLVGEPEVVEDYSI
jgi:hypothetical protein